MCNYCHSALTWEAKLHSGKSVYCSCKGTIYRSRCSRAWLNQSQLVTVECKNMSKVWSQLIQCSLGALHRDKARVRSRFRKCDSRGMFALIWARLLGSSCLGLVDSWRVLRDYTFNVLYTWYILLAICYCWLLGNFTFWPKEQRCISNLQKNAHGEHSTQEACRVSTLGWKFVGSPIKAQP